MVDVMRRLVEHRVPELVVAGVTRHPGCPMPRPRSAASRGCRADAGFPPYLRYAGPQLVTERAALRLVIEHGYGHEDYHVRTSDFQSCHGTTVQQQNAATAPIGNDRHMTGIGL